MKLLSVKISNKRYISVQVSDEDFEYLNQFEWEKNLEIGYIYTHIFAQNILLIRVIMNRIINPDLYISLNSFPHMKFIQDIIYQIDNNKNNFQRNNLKIIFKDDKAYDMYISLRNNDGMDNIYKEETKVRGEIIYNWRATLRVNKKVYKKRFDCNAEGLIKAQKWVDKMNLKLYGENAILNFPRNIYPQNIDNDEDIYLEFFASSIRKRIKRNRDSGFFGVATTQQKKIHKDGTKLIYNYWLVYMKYDGKLINKKFPYTEEGKIEAAKFFDKIAYERYHVKDILNFPNEIKD